MLESRIRYVYLIWEADIYTSLASTECHPHIYIRTFSDVGPTAQHEVNRYLPFEGCQSYWQSNGRCTVDEWFFCGSYTFSKSVRTFDVPGS